MYPLGAEYADVLCPDCRRVMVELERYAPVAGSDSALVDDSAPPLSMHGGNDAWESAALFGFLVGMIANLFMGAFRRRKVQRLCQELLPNYPKTLICPACLFVARRK